jgi:hypothetical protein
MGGTYTSHLPFLEEYNLSEDKFRTLLHGADTIGLLDQEWAVKRLIEEAPYTEIIRMVGLPALVQNWPRWRLWVTSTYRRRGLDFLMAYLQFNYPETFGKPKHG